MATPYPDSGAQKVRYGCNPRLGLAGGALFADNFGVAWNVVLENQQPPLNDPAGPNLLRSSKSKQMFKKAIKVDWLAVYDRAATAHSTRARSLYCVAVFIHGAEKPDNATRSLYGIP